MDNQEQFLAQSANRFMEKVAARQEAIAMTEAQRESKKTIDAEYKAFVDSVVEEKATIQNNYQLAIAAAQDVVTESIADLKSKCKAAKELRVEEYVKAGIAKEHIPAGDQVAAGLDNVATKIIGNAAKLIGNTKDYLKRKAAGKRG